MPDGPAGRCGMHGSTAIRALFPLFSTYKVSHSFNTYRSVNKNCTRFLFRIDCSPAYFAHFDMSR